MMKNRFFVVSILIMLAMVLLAGFAFSQIQTQPSSQPNPSIGECKDLYWFDNQTRECGLKSFCGTYMYQGLQTFNTKEECQKALEEGEAVPVESPTPENECKTLYWFDSRSKACGLKSFCGAYMYQGLRTFKEKEECQKALDEFLGTPTSEGDSENQTESHVINNVTVSTGSSESSEGSTVGTGTVYSVGACPSTIPEVCPEEKEPVCATISHFAFDGSYKKYKKTFDNWCKACKASTRTDLVISYVKGKCEQESTGCPIISKPEAEFCPNGKIKAVYKEFNGKKCIVGYRCIAPVNPVDELPVFIYSESNALVRTTKTFKLYKSGAMLETTTTPSYRFGVPVAQKNYAGKYGAARREIKKLKGKISPEETLEFLKKLDELGFFEIEYLKDCRTGAAITQTGNTITGSTTTTDNPTSTNGPTSTTSSTTTGSSSNNTTGSTTASGTSTGAPSSIGVISCPTGAANHTIYARFNRENKLHWYDGLTSEPEAISYALERVKEFEKLMEENPFNSNILVQLGEAFNLQIGQRATVRETGLKVRLERIEGGTATISVHPLLRPLLEKTTSANEEGNRSTTAGNKGTAQVMSRWIKLKPGEKKSVYGHTISLNSLMTPKCSEEALTSENVTTKCIGAKPFANLTITKTEYPNKEIKAFLEKKFEIMQGQTARLFDEHKNPVMTMHLTRIDIPSGCNVGSCKVDKNTGITVCPMIWCDERPVAKILWERVFKSGELKPLMKMKPRMLAIRRGEVKISGNFKFYFADLINGKAVFVVSNAEQEISFQKVSLGEEFKLREKETALIEDKDIFVTLVKTVSLSGISVNENQNVKAYPQKEYAIVSVWKKGWGVAPIGPVPLTKSAIKRVEKIRANIKKVKAEKTQGSAGVGSAITKTGITNKPKPIPVMPYKKTYMLKPGQTLKIYDIKLTLKGLGEKSAKFVANALGQGNTINVQVGEPFKLEENMSARVLRANMRIDLLGIASNTICAETYPEQCTDTKTVKIGVSKLAFEKIKEKIGEPVENSVVEEEAAKHLIESSARESTVSAQIPSIEIPPMPFRVFELGEGEAASVGNFEIKVNAIWENTAELVVKEKSTGLKFQYTIEKGWNLFSLPGEIRPSGKSECHTSNFRLFKYATGKKRFKKVTKALPGEAYWLYNPGEVCNVTAELVKPVSVFELEELQKGWNFVPIVKEMIGKSIDEMGNCKFKGAFFYSPGETKWIKALGTKITEQDLGKSLAVFAEEKCSLVNPETPVPEIPELPEVE